MDKLEKGSVEWNNAMIRMLLQLKKDGHKIKEYVSGSGNKVSAAVYSRKGEGDICLGNTVKWDSGNTYL